MTQDTAARPGDDQAAPEGFSAEPRASRSGRPVVRRVLVIVALVIVVLLAFWLFRYWTVGRFTETTDDAYIQADPVVVAPKVAGYVEQVYVADNQTVQAGQALFRIDARDYRAQVAQANAQIDVARAGATTLRAQIAEQQAVVAGVRAQLGAAQSDLALATASDERYRTLSATGAESRESYNEKHRILENARAAVAQRRADLESATRRIASLRSQIGEAGARAEGAEAQRTVADIDLGSTTVRASIAGRVGNKTVQPGQYIQPGTRAMSIVPVEHLHIEANFKETQVGLIRVGQPVRIEVDALDGVQVRGRVESFAPGTGAQFSLIPPENATGNFTKIVQRIPVRIAIDASPEVRKILLPGMSVSVSVDTSSAKGSLEALENK